MQVIQNLEAIQLVAGIDHRISLQVDHLLNKKINSFILYNPETRVLSPIDETEIVKLGDISPETYLKMREYNRNILT